MAVVALKSHPVSYWLKLEPRCDDGIGGRHGLHGRPLLKGDTMKLALLLSLAILMSGCASTGTTATAKMQDSKCLSGRT